jgi:uncharacterized protein YpmB
MKFLVILLGIFLAVFLFIAWIFKKIISLFMPFRAASAKKDNFSQEQHNRQDSTVIYKKDDVVVMKGDAGKKNN